MEEEREEVEEVEGEEGGEVEVVEGSRWSCWKEGEGRDLQRIFFQSCILQTNELSRARNREVDG